MTMGVGSIVVTRVVAGLGGGEGGSGAVVVRVVRAEAVWVADARTSVTAVARAAVAAAGKARLAAARARAARAAAARAEAARAERAYLQHSKTGGHH